GKSGASLIDSFDTSNFACKFSASVKNFNPEDYDISTKDARKMDLFIQYGLAAAIVALADSGLDITEENAERIGVAVGSGIGGLITIEKTHTAYMEGGPRKISPFFIPATIINMISGHLSIRYGLRGPNISVVSACTTGTHNIGEAARMISYGSADVMIAGGTEMATCPLGVGGFAACRALSLRNDDPTRASRPWDKDRDGFLLGDGAGILILESYEHAKQRGAHIYAELTGFGMSADAYHMTSPSPNGEGAMMAMINTLRDANVSPEQVDYINAHATSTPAGDECEAQAIKHAFGAHAYKLAVSSTKSMIGHLLGAAGAVEAIFGILAIRDQIAPPTINLENPSEGCDLDFVPNVARPMKIDTALSNSFGFGGTNGALLFQKLS
ncbi:MAG TPA: beta-ketoacyl-ACP synthase II, partial [Coxiellaceae bacterium]|nr:beta-ketoacyl-ACP synthase II [Coxiellaceae bacterium]